MVDRTLIDAVDLAAIGHTIEAIGRTGATATEFGHLDVDPPGRWWATARYEGRKVTCDNQEDALAAVLGLYVMVAAGGVCTDCDRVVACEGAAGYLAGAARMSPDGVFETLDARELHDQWCVRRLDLDGWTGCTTGDSR